MKTRDITERQLHVLFTISDYIAEKGYSPSLKNIADMEGGIKVNAADGHVKSLINKGYLEKEKGEPRTISLTDKAKIEVGEWASVRLPWCLYNQLIEKCELHKVNIEEYIESLYKKASHPSGR